jgi:polyhydroxyalkanoate synthase
MSSFAVTTSGSKLSFDRPLHATMAHFTGGVSPSALSQAYVDWFQHLLFSPDTQMRLAAKAVNRRWALLLPEPVMCGLDIYDHLAKGRW